MGIPQRFYSLDVMRGLAALSVVLWHWQNFFYTGTTPGGVPPDQQPFYAVLFPLYNAGQLGVDIFFCLSGFIFYWLYSDAVRNRRVTGRQFALLRFSRLYPLHFVTLAAVAIGQAIFFREIGAYYVYSYNDPYHFALHSLFASSWGLEKAYSFNGPAWSISVEVALYALFFMLCRLLPIRIPVLLCASAAGFLAIDVYPPIGVGLFCFFNGGLAYLIYAWLVETPRATPIGKWLPWVCAVLWTGAFAIVGTQWGAGLPGRVAYFYLAGLAFPLTILALALVETRSGPLGRRAAVLGDISYSTYLLHFPLQLAVMLLASLAGLDRSIFLSPYALMGFLALLFVISLASSRLLERPMQRALRGNSLASYNSRLQTR